MGFPHRGLLRKLRQPARHRCHAPLNIPRWPCPLYLSGLRHTEETARRTLCLACCRLAEVSSPNAMDVAAPVCCLHVRTPSTVRAYVSLPVPSSDHVGRGDVYKPQCRINGGMFFSLSVIKPEDHPGLVISSQSPLSAGYITLRACCRSGSPPSYPVGLSGRSSWVTGSIYQTDSWFIWTSIPAPNSGYTVDNIGYPHLIGLHNIDCSSPWRAGIPTSRSRT